MRVGDIKTEALRLTVGASEEIYYGNLKNLAVNPNYAPYLQGMNGIINRALKRIETLLKAPVRVAEVTGDAYGDCIRLDLSAVRDFYAAHRLDALTRRGLEKNIDFDHVGGDVILTYTASDKYLLAYNPKLKMLSDTASDAEECELPDHIAVLIPYYVKSELLEQDEPSIAAGARNAFEAALEEMDEAQKSVQRKVRTIQL